MLSFAVILVLGFLLGMRHATDPDHVIAVTTIVSKQRGIAKAGLIGVLWGLGHTLTIFVVGAVVILFKVAIPPRARPFDGTRCWHDADSARSSKPHRCAALVAAEIHSGQRAAASDAYPR